MGIKQGFRIGKGWQGYMDLSAFGMYYDNMIEINFGQFEKVEFLTQVISPAFFRRLVSSSKMLVKHALLARSLPS